MTEDTNSEAWERACAIVDRKMMDTEYPCKYGHLDCSTSPRGRCLNEETHREYERQKQKG